MDGYYDITIKIGYPDRLVPKYAGGEYTAQCDVGEDNLLFLIERTNDREFLEYCELLEGKGYSLHSENSLSGNIFKTYVSSEQMGAVDKRQDFTPSSQLYGIIRKTGGV